MSHFAGHIVFVAISVSLLGCGPTGVTERLRISRQSIKTTKPQEGSDIFDAKGLASLAACLDRASERSLAEPEICFARLFSRLGRQTLVLYWIAKEPTVDGIRLAWGKDSDVDYVDVAIDDVTLALQKEDIGRSVIFPAMVRFPFAVVDSDQMKLQNGIRVALLKNGVVVSGELEVDQTYLSRATANDEE